MGVIVLGTRYFVYSIPIFDPLVAHAKSKKQKALDYPRFSIPQACISLTLDPELVHIVIDLGTKVQYDPRMIVGVLLFCALAELIWANKHRRFCTHLLSHLF